MKNYPEEEGYCLNLGKCWYQASNYKKEFSLVLWCCSIYNCNVFVQKLTAFLKTLPKNVQRAWNIQQSARQGDSNANLSVVAETVKLHHKRSYGYKNMNRSQLTVTKYLTDGKTHAAFKSKLSWKLDHLKISLFEDELAKAQIEHKKPLIVGSFTLQYKKLRMLELYCTFSPKFVI